MEKIILPLTVKRNVMKKGVIIAVISLAVFSFNMAVAARPKQSLDSTEYVWREHIKLSPHSVQINCATLMYYKEAYKMFNKMPPLNFSATYTFDIPWWYKRVNFFVLSGLGFESCRREGKHYQAEYGVFYGNYVYNQYHAFLGMGIRLHLSKSLDLALSSAVNGSFAAERGRYLSLPNNEFYIPNDNHGFGMQGLFKMNLTYEIKRICISAGCQVYLGSNRHAETEYWKNAAQPYRSWATLGVGYRF